MKNIKNNAYDGLSNSTSDNAYDSALKSTADNAHDSASKSTSDNAYDSALRSTSDNAHANSSGRTNSEKTKYPLRKRLKRELIGDFRKYLSLFIMLTVVIGATAGMYVANGSMEKTLEGGYEKYNIENGHFALKKVPTDRLLEKIEAEGVTLSKQYNKEATEDIDGDGKKESDVRLFVIREDMNRICLMDGQFPKTADEIAIDRMHADNNEIEIGDTITVAGRKLTVSGFVSFSDYSTLFRKNTDIMFDALTFDVACMTREGYDLVDAEEKYEYAFKYKESPANDNEQKVLSDDFIPKLATLAATGGMLDDADKALDLKNRANKMQTLMAEMAAQQQAIMAAGMGEEQQTLMAAGMSEEQQTLMAAGMSEEQQALMAAGMGEEQQELLTQEELADIEEYEPDFNELTEFVPEYLNSAIHFAPNDFGNDKMLVSILLYILVAVLAFIFAITASSMIVKESAVIGTLRASGYTKGELVRHYLAIPIAVTLISAVVGNVLGYAWLKDVVVGMYYNSYSLPTYETTWSSEALLRTTLIPVGITMLVNIVVISVKMRFTPLQFLRGDLGSRKRKKAIKLPNIKFFGRFRFRILFSNIGGYLVMFFGIAFVCVLLGFALGVPSTLSNYQENSADLMLAEHEYVLMDSKDADGNELTTSEPSAEPYSMMTLLETNDPHVGENITVYGYMDDSRYFKDADKMLGADAAGNDTRKVLITSSYADKFSLGVGRKITLKEQFTDVTYDFEVAGIYPLDGTLAVLMHNDDFNETFSLEKGSFNGFLSEKEITDIDGKYIASDITIDVILKVTKQLDHSIGNYMTYFQFICVIIAIVIIYLLTKIIVEKNSISISMVKVLGYTASEIKRLYIRITTIVVVIATGAGIFIGKVFLTYVWKVFMYRMSGWFEFVLTPLDMVKMFIATIIAYCVVVLLDIRRIRKIPMTDALKNVE
ncbi:MAG: ABC transporter permease [Lachnospiraceae bacterium]|nr:ABC transporter permease [Lachnospiraceae bacterium]